MYNGRSDSYNAELAVQALFRLVHMDTADVGASCCFRQRVRKAPRLSYGAVEIWVSSDSFDPGAGHMRYIDACEVRVARESANGVVELESRDTRGRDVLPGRDAPNTLTSLRHAFLQPPFTSIRRSVMVRVHTNHPTTCWQYA